MKKLIKNFLEAKKFIKKASNIICDVDGTVTEDLKPIGPIMSLIMTLNYHQGKNFVFMSGTNIIELQRMISNNLAFKHILCGSSGAHIVEINPLIEKETELIHIVIPEEDRKYVIKCLEELVVEFNLPKVENQILDRVSQITLSCLGRYANPSQKNIFDPEGTKRFEMINFLKTKLPEYSMKVGGTTSIDVLKNEFDKAKGITYLMSLVKSITEKNTIFIGDKLMEGGNDYPALQIVDCIQVKDPEELKSLFKMSLN